MLYNEHGCWNSRSTFSDSGHLEFFFRNKSFIQEKYNCTCILWYNGEEKLDFFQPAKLLLLVFKLQQLGEKKSSYQSWYIEMKTSHNVFVMNTAKASYMTNNPNFMFLVGLT